MPSDYSGFDVLIDNDDGSVAPAAGVTVKVFDITDADSETGTGAIALADVLADASGHVASGTAVVAAGRTLRFAWFRAGDGMCGFTETVTF